MRRAITSSTGASETIYRLRRQIDREEDNGKLRDLAVRLQIALSEEQMKTTM
jgi:hypothetical protein